MKNGLNGLKCFVFALFAVTIAHGNLARAGLYEGLTPEEKALVDRGEQAVRLEPVAGSAWPRITVFQKFAVTPEEIAAVMFDYDRHKEFYEGMTHSKAASPGSPATDVDYVMTFPPVLGIQLPDEVYTVHDVLSRFGTEGYEVAWTMVKASSMNDTRGSAKFEKLGDGVFLSYTNFINPPRPQLAKLIVKMAIGRVKDAAKSLGAQVVRERGERPSLLEEQKAALAKALGR